MKTLTTLAAMVLSTTSAFAQPAMVARTDKGEVLLVTSRGTGRWIIPKGWPMSGRSMAEAALQEAWEEAGVRPQPDAPMLELGRYHYDKMQDSGFGIPVEVRVFVVPVDTLADQWPEQAQRSRRWFPPAQAAAMVAEPELAALLRGVAARAA